MQYFISIIGLISFENLLKIFQTLGVFRYFAKVFLWIP